MHSLLNEAVELRFMRYVRIDTQSDPESETFPSTARQFDLLRLLENELCEMGAQDVHLNEWGYLTATIPATVRHEVPVVAFVAHVDTSPDVSGAGVKPKVHHYTGGELVISPASGVTISAAALQPYRGDQIITSDGTTLLGADDKAGVAEIVHAASHLLSHPEIEHGVIRLLFTPDEEVGRGTDRLDVTTLGARYGYTVDGGAEGTLEFETFHAAEAMVTIRGYNTHPGYAKGKMINAQQLAIELHGLLPTDERPEATEGVEGFYHLTAMQGEVAQATLHYIIRDHDRTRFEERKSHLICCVAQLNARYGEDYIAVNIRDQYYNMREQIEPCMEVVEVAREAMLSLGITPQEEPIRGGTDGSRLSYLGLPCPNLFNGSEQIHSVGEFVSVRVMQLSVEVLIEIVRRFAVAARPQ